MLRIAFVVAVFFGSTVLAKPMAPVFAPVDRLIKNARSAVKRTPKDAEAHYVLGRLLSMQYVGKTKAEVQSEGGAGIAPIMFGTGVRGQGSDGPTSKPLAEAIAEFEACEKIDTTDLRPALALGWAHLERAKGKTADAENAAAKREYERVVELGKPAAPHTFERDAAIEAAKALIGLSPKDADALRKFIDESQNAAVEPRNVIMSPLLVLLDGSRALAPAIDNRAHVHFDLRARRDGLAWPWPKPQTGILVWDPRRTGSVTSGWELFGNATWNVFFSDGYRALALLDDDGDGRLRGAELDGVRVWVDSNHDGVCAQAEVHELNELGIVSLAVESDAKREGVPSNLSGATLRDGRTLATFDWTPTSVPEPTATR